VTDGNVNVYGTRLPAQWACPKSGDRDNLLILMTGRRSKSSRDLHS